MLQNLYTFLSLLGSLLIIINNVWNNFKKYKVIYKNKFGVGNLTSPFIIHLLSFYIAEILSIIQWIFYVNMKNYILFFIIIGTYYGLLLYPLIIQTPIMFITNFAIFTEFIILIYNIYIDNINISDVLIALTETSMERILYYILINNEYPHKYAKDISHILYGSLSFFIVVFLFSL